MEGEIIGPVKMDLYDVHGNLLSSQYMGSSKRFDLSEMGLPEGIYVAELFHNGNSQSIKLIKRRKHK